MSKAEFYKINNNENESDITKSSLFKATLTLSHLNRYYVFRKNSVVKLKSVNRK